MQITDAHIYKNITIQPPKYYIKDILPEEGIMLLFGAPKLGKSWLAKQAAFSIATGKDFLGLPTKQAKVLIVQFEIAIRAYQWRLKTLLQGAYKDLEPSHLYTASPGQMNLDDDEVFEPFANVIESIHPNVIVLDCLQACFGGDENSSRDIGEFISNIEKLKARNNAAIILVHHSRKTQAGTASTSNDARGQSRISGWVDTLCSMNKKPNCVELNFMARQATRELPDLKINFGTDNTFTIR